jgi:hypothetical protein
MCGHPCKQPGRDACHSKLASSRDSGQHLLAVLHIQRVGQRVYAGLRKSIRALEEHMLVWSCQSQTYHSARSHHAQVLRKGVHTNIYVRASSGGLSVFLITESLAPRQFNPNYVATKLPFLTLNPGVTGTYGCGVSRRSLICLFMGGRLLGGEGRVSFIRVPMDRGGVHQHPFSEFILLEPCRQTITYCT